MLDPLLTGGDSGSGGGRGGDNSSGGGSGEPQVRVNSVVFEPGARTFWHSHAGGQVLLVASGSGAVGTRDGEHRALRPGDTVWAPPGEEHWHGAGPDSFLVHTAVSLGGTEWLEEVGEDHYGTAFKETGFKETGLKETGLKETGLKETTSRETAFKE